MSNIVVIGAGLAGLAAARRLVARGHEVTVVEASAAAIRAPSASASLTQARLGPPGRQRAAVGQAKTSRAAVTRAATRAACLATRARPGRLPVP
jgi:glycine/D-amino acid oxidase-like deaminating enzyme